MDEETQHYARVYKAKRARLNVLEEQIAAIGEYNVLPHIAMERDSLKEELGMFVIAMESPARAEAGEELGPAGRFKVYYQQNQEIKKSIAALLARTMPELRQCFAVKEECFHDGRSNPQDRVRRALVASSSCSEGAQP